MKVGSLCKLKRIAGIQACRAGIASRQRRILGFETAALGLSAGKGATEPKTCAEGIESRNNRRGRRGRHVFSASRAKPGKSKAASLAGLAGETR
ncbi:MAG: hypothetical protein LBU32_20165 [Clostridiales bacterium]|nr:hypothetical protein [Clostridiales bacterium]